MNRTGARPDKLSNPTSLRSFSQIEQPLNRPSRDAKVSPEAQGTWFASHRCDRAYADPAAPRLANFGRVALTRRRHR
jgi:hypothetical protein